MVWRLWLQAEFLHAKGDTTLVWTVPLWPVAVAVAVGSVLFLYRRAVAADRRLARLLHPAARRRCRPPGRRPFRE